MLKVFDASKKRDVQTYKQKGRGQCWSNKKWLFATGYITVVCDCASNKRLIEKQRENFKLEKLLDPVAKNLPIMVKNIQSLFPPSPNFWQNNCKLW